MQIIENLKVKEKLFVEKLENGMTVLIIPKENSDKKYVIWGTNFGSLDNDFVIPGENKDTQIPDGVAHFLEHKMFEQENGTNSLDVLSALGVNANAFTTNDYTAYLFETTDNFYEALDELMNYVQNPYFTDENVEKEKGIIAQEIRMYDDQPGWQLYMNAMKCLYKKHAITIDIAGTVESIGKINKEILYNCYNTFYNPSNMVLVVSGNFKPEEILEEIKKRLIKKPIIGEIKRTYPVEDEEINKKEIQVNMEVSNPIFMMAYKDKQVENKDELVKKQIALQILLYMVMGKSSKLYKELYEAGEILGTIDTAYEFGKGYAHVVISGQTQNPKKVIDRITDELRKVKENGLDEKVFARVKKKIYGDYIIEYNDVSEIGRMFLEDYLKGINSFDYLENYDAVSCEYAKEILDEVFDEKKQVVSIVNPK